MSDETTCRVANVARAPSPATAAGTSSQAPGRGRIRVQRSIRAVLSRQVIRLEIAIIPKKPRAPYRGTNSTAARIRTPESSTAYRKVASCSPNPFRMPSTMLSRYINGATQPSRETYSPTASSR